MTSSVDSPNCQIASEFPVALSYKDELTKAMESLAQDPLVRFVGYGVKIGGLAGGTLKNVSDSQLIEMPVAENLMVGFAIGLSLKGLKPVVFIERMDFWWNASDAIVNHLDKINQISHGEFNPTMILRIVVGNRNKPLFTGATHTRDYSPSLRAAVSFPVINLTDPARIENHYKASHICLDGEGRHSTALIEYKDLI
jgi:pyruvate/2-oxoglutarate/acetoin dehydrogenase E1 component